MIAAIGLRVLREGMKHILNDILSSSQFSEGTAWKRLSYKVGEKIIEKGEIGSSLFLVEHGTVRVLGGADICLYGSHRRTASVVCLTDVCILEIRSDLLSVYLDDHPVQGYLFLKGLFEIMAKRLELANDRIDKLLAWGIKAHDIDKYL